MAPVRVKSAEPSASTDDMALLRRYVELGCEDSFSQIVQRHLNWVYSVCRRGLKDPHLAEDAAQAVFLILARRAKTISPSVHLSGWLFKACRFAVADARKREFRHQRRQDLGMRLGIERMEQAEAHPSTASDPVSPLLDETLASLKDSDRQALMMHFYEGMTIPQMGIALGVSAEGAKKRVTRALQRLREQFARRKVAVSVGLLCTFFYHQATEAAPLGMAEIATVTALGQGPIPISTAAIAQGIVALMGSATQRLLKALLVAELAAVTIVSSLSLIHTSSTPPAQASAPDASVFPLGDRGNGTASTVTAPGGFRPASDAVTAELFATAEQPYTHIEPALADDSDPVPAEAPSPVAAGPQPATTPLKAGAMAGGSSDDSPISPMGGSSWVGAGLRLLPPPPVRPRPSMPTLDFMQAPLALSPQNPVVLPPLTSKPSEPIADLFRVKIEPDDYVDLEHGLIFDHLPTGDYSIYSLNDLTLLDGYAQGYLAPHRYTPQELDGFKQSWLDLHATPVPEPGAISLLGAAALLLRRRRARH